MEMHYHCPLQHSNASMALAFFACSVISSWAHMTCHTRFFSPTLMFTHICKEIHIYIWIVIFSFSHNWSIWAFMDDEGETPGGNSSCFWCFNELPFCAKSCQDSFEDLLKAQNCSEKLETSWSIMLVLNISLSYLKGSTSSEDGSVNPRDLFFFPLWAHNVGVSVLPAPY